MILKSNAQKTNSKQTGENSVKPTPNFLNEIKKEINLNQVSSKQNTSLKQKHSAPNSLLDEKGKTAPVVKQTKPPVVKQQTKPTDVVKQQTKPTNVDILRYAVKKRRYKVAQQKSDSGESKLEKTLQQKPSTKRVLKQKSTRTNLLNSKPNVVFSKQNSLKQRQSAPISLHQNIINIREKLKHVEQQTKPVVKQTNPLTNSVQGFFARRPTHKVAQPNEPSDSDSGW